MLQYIKTYLQHGNYFNSVEHALKGDQDILHASILKKTKNEVYIKTIFSAKNIDEFIKKTPKKKHISLIINNAHVLSKQIETEQTEKDQLVYKAFPNINLNDFYYEIIIQNKSHFVSICRKSYVQDLLGSYKKHGFSIVNLSLGNNMVSVLSGFIKTNELSTSNARILFKHKNLNVIKKTNIEEGLNYNINGLQVNSTHTLSFSGALQPILNNFFSTTNFDDLKNGLKNEHHQLRFFNLFLKFGLGFILTTLLINFLVFNYYFGEVNMLQQTSQINLTNKEKILRLKERMNKSQKMVDDMLKGGHSKSAYYLNIIAKTLPSSILLSEFNYQPLKRTIKPNKPIELNLNTIIVSGASNNSENFSRWLLSIETLPSVNQVDILSYENVSQSISNFSLKLNINRDK